MTSDNYWLSLEGEKLALHCCPYSTTTFEETNDYAILGYSAGTGVYGQWHNYRYIDGFVLNIRDENMELVRTVNTVSKNTRYSVVLETYKTYWFCLNPILESDVWEDIYQNAIIEGCIHIAFCDENVQLRKESDITPPGSDGVEFPLYFAYYNIIEWLQTTTIQIVISGYVLSLEAYFN